MKNSFLLLMWVYSFITLYTCNAEVIFFDGFGGTSLTNDWIVASNSIGRTEFGIAPTISNGMATFHVNTFNPNNPGNSFQGTELVTQSLFSLEKGKQFEVRLRVNSPTVGGLVAGIFPFGFDSTTLQSDEIDIEILSNWINTPSLSNQVKVVTWDNIDQTTGIPESMAEADIAVDGLNTADFNTYRINWYPNQVSWFY